MMIVGSRPRVRGLWSTSISVILAFIFLHGTVGRAAAQQVSDETEIGITVFATGDAPDQEHQYTSVNPVSGGELSTRMLPGTVSANLTLAPPGTTRVRPGEMVVNLVVRDERGTAAGWNIVMDVVTPSTVPHLPVLGENLLNSSEQLVPAGESVAQPASGVESGRTVGTFDQPIPVLHASTRSGSGIIQHQMVLVVPLTGDATTAARVITQIASAP